MRVRAAVLVLIGVGLAFWSRAYLLAGEHGLDPVTVGAIVAAVVVLVIPALRAAWTRALDRIRDARPLLVGGLLFLLALTELTCAGLTSRAYLRPKSHDECSYTLGALMLASGRLWTASPGAPDSFESFHIFTRPVYASIYAPGVALLHVPGLWLHLPGWVTAILLSAAAVAVTYALLRLVVPGDLAVLGALLLLGTSQFRSHSVLIMSQVPSLLLGAGTLATAAWWGRSPSYGRAAVVGLVGGLLMLVRPQDAACFLPGALVICLSARTNLSWSRRTRHAAIALLSMLPAIGLMGLQNWGLTGSVFRTAYWEYTRTMQPGTGFLSDQVNAKPATLIPQKIIYNSTFGGVRRQQREHGALNDIARRRVPLTLHNALPGAWMAVFVPLGLVGLWRPGSAAGILASLASFALVYGTFTFFEGHYVIPISLGIIALVVAAPAGVERLAPAWSPHARLLITALGLASLVAALPETNPQAHDWQMRTDQLQLADRVEARLPSKPALLLFRYSPTLSVHQEPVYNLKSWRIDDNEVIRAHDLGPDLNAALFKSLALKHPARPVYLLDRATGQVQPLGTLSDLAAPKIDPSP